MDAQQGNLEPDDCRTACEEPASRRKDPCRFNDNLATPRKVVDALTGELRYRTPGEQREHERTRKSKNYWDIQSIERIRTLRRERYRAFQRKKQRTSINAKGRHTDNEGSPSVRKRQLHWASVLREVKQQWSENMIQEQARLLAAYHHVGSMRAPLWVKRDVYASMERRYRRSGFWVPERGIFWVVDSFTDDSSESDESDESTESSNTDELEDM